MQPPFEIDWIQTVLPHRYPFLLIDRVVELLPGERAVAIKNVSVNEPFFSGHFPMRPVMPGVLILEALAQTAAVLFIHDRGDREQSLFYLTGVERARFRRPVVPGNQLRLEVAIDRLRTSFARFAGRALVDGEVAAEALLSSARVDR